jgi:predicted DsbA family dithiol-disulfide isomerase
VRIEKLKANYGLNVKFTPFPLHPETPEEGKPRAANPARDARMKALMDQEGLPYNSERGMTYNSRLAQELAKWAESKGKGYEIHDPLFRAFFVEVKNIGDGEVLAKIAKSVGLPADEALDALASRSFKKAVDDDWRRCAELSVNAVPTFVVGPSTSLRTRRYALVGAHPYEELEKLVAKAS